MISTHDQLTPRPRPYEQNPFDHWSPGPATPTGLQHRLGHPLASPGAQPSTPPIHPLLQQAPAFSAALTPPPSSFGQPTTQLSIHAPVFNMYIPQNKLAKRSSPAPSPPTSTAPPSSKGQIHLKLIQGRALNVRTLDARPYVVVQFEHNEFVSREPTSESHSDIKHNSPSSALSALGAIGSRVAATNRTTASNPALIGRVFPHNPVWKHEVSFDVTSEDSEITCMVYDRASSDQGFLGTVKIKPVLRHDHTVDDWYKLQSIQEDEQVSGEIRVQVTFEQYKTKRALTPRDFEFLKLIGVGTFGKVFQVRKKDTRRIYAMKVLSKKEIVAKKEVAHTIGERKILQKSLDSPFLVGLKFSFQTDTDLYLVTDFKSGGELFWHLQRETRFSEDRARFYVAELTLALEHLHKYNIVYRDLKPENILLDATGHVALCDFGLSKANLRPDELTTTFCGTTEYLAPEILLDEQGYSKIVDFWSLGVLLFEMCCGWSPFYAEDTQQMYKNICFGKIRFPKGVICEDGKQFVKALLNRNPKHRLGAKRDAAELREHPFFNGIDWAVLARKEIPPPFKPIVESDESVNNFDPEFTSADISKMLSRGDNDELDDDDPSEAWVSRSISQQNGMFVHTPNGPLGSERRSSTSSTSSQQRFGGLAPLSSMNGNGTTKTGMTNGHHNKATQQQRTTSTGSTTPTGTKGIEIKSNKKRGQDGSGSPLTNSVQENFRGFTYHGESLVVPPSVLSHQSKKSAVNSDRGAVDDDDDEEPGVTTEDEVEDTKKSAGRYANIRKKGFGFSSIDDDLIMS